MRKYTEKYGKERPGEHSCQVRRVGLDPGSHKGNVNNVCIGNFKDIVECII